MGYKTIEAKRTELKGKIAVYEKLVATAKSISVQMDKIDHHLEQVHKEQQQMVTVLGKVAGEMDKLDTKDVEEFEDYRKALVEVTQQGGWAHPLPTAPMAAAVSKMEKRVWAEYWAWIEKLTANIPAEIKPGMVFVDKKNGCTYEIKSAGKKAPNANLQGDAAIFYDAVRYDENGGGRQQQTSVSKLDLSPRNNVKYVRT